MNARHDPADVPLDGLLRTWADNCTADTSGESRLLRAILTEAAQPGKTSRGLLQMAPVSGQQPWSVLVVCAVAVLLLAVALTLPVTPRLAAPTVAVRSASVQPGETVPVGLPDLWNRTADLFGPHLNWLCDLDGELLLGVDPGTAAVSEQDRAYVLLTVQVRDAQSRRWTPVWTGRVVCPLGQAVDFDSKVTDSGGSIWLQTRPNGRVVASHWLNWPDHPEISGAIETEVAPGETRVIAERITEGRSIQVVQQVWMANAG